MNYFVSYTGDLNGSTVFGHIIIDGEITTKNIGKLETDIEETKNLRKVSILSWQEVKDGYANSGKKDDKTAENLADFLKGKAPKASDIDAYINRAMGDGIKALEDVASEIKEFFDKKKV